MVPVNQTYAAPAPPRSCCRRRARRWCSSPRRRRLWSARPRHRTSTSPAPRGLAEYHDDGPEHAGKRAAVDGGGPCAGRRPGGSGRRAGPAPGGTGDRRAGYILTNPGVIDRSSAPSAGSWRSGPIPASRWPRPRRRPSAPSADDRGPGVHRPAGPGGGRRAPRVPAQRDAPCGAIAPAQAVPARQEPRGADRLAPVRDGHLRPSRPRGRPGLAPAATAAATRLAALP